MQVKLVMSYGGCGTATTSHATYLLEQGGERGTEGVDEREAGDEAEAVRRVGQRHRKRPCHRRHEGIAADGYAGAAVPQLCSRVEASKIVELTDLCLSYQAV